MYERAIWMSKQSQNDPGLQYCGRNPLISTATVIFNLGLVHHTLALTNATSKEQLLTKAHLLYEEAVSLVIDSDSATNQPQRPDHVLLLALYNNLAHVAFQIGRYNTASMYAERLYRLVLESSTPQHPRSFLRNVIFLLATTQAAAA